MTLDELLAVAEVVEKLTIRYRDQEAAHKAALTEIRASFNARTIADGKRYEGILDTYHRSALDTIDAALKREESTASVAKRLVEERDGLLTQVQDMRAEMERLRSENRIMQQDAEDGYTEAIKVLGDPIALSKERDALRAEVAALKSQTPQHPAKVGEWVKAPLGTRGKVVSLGVDYLEVELTNGPPTRWWPVYMCEPCDPPEATHDTEAGKAAAEAVIREISLKDVRKVTT